LGNDIPVLPVTTCATWYTCQSLNTLYAWNCEDRVGSGVRMVYCRNLEISRSDAPPGGVKLVARRRRW